MASNSGGKSERPQNKHLKPIPIKPGEARNPKGSSRKARELYNFRQWIKETCPNDPILVFKRLSELAKTSRDFRYLQEYLDRTQGKVPNKTQLTGEDGGAIKFEVVLRSKEAIKASEIIRKKFSGEN